MMLAERRDAAPSEVRGRRCGPYALAARSLAALATGLAGALSVASALSHAHAHREALAPRSAAGFEHLLAAAGGMGLLLLAWGMLRGRRRAATAAVGVLLGVALVHAVNGVGYRQSAIALALAALLYANRRAFNRGGAARPGVLAATIAVAAVAMGYLLAALALMLARHRSSLGAALGGAAHLLASGAWWLRSGEPIAVALDVLLVLTLVAAAQTLRALLRPAATALGHSEADHRRAADIVSRYGSDALDPFALREDKSYFFAYGGLLAYRTLRETAVVSADPIGPPGAARAIVADFLAFAADRGWDVVVTAASPRYLRDYRALGLRALRIGDEAVLAPDRFSLAGRSIRKVRQSVNRVARRGWSVEVVDGLGPSAALVRELEAVERAWHARRPRLYGFAMTLGRLWGAPEDSHDVVYVLGRDPSRRLCAFIRFVRSGDGLSLDVMRRSGGEPNGLNEAMIVKALAYARERGLAEVSLNFAGFAHVMSAHASLSRSQRLMRTLLRRVHGRFQLERLVRFNEKFEPTWRPRYLIYGARTHLPLAALRVLQAETYLRPPRSRPLKQRWQPLPHPVESGVLLAQSETPR